MLPSEVWCRRSAVGRAAIEGLVSRAAAAFCIVSLVSSSTSLHAQGAPTRRHVTASLVAERDGVQPGRPLSVGIRLQMEPGWHTYWRNPGDSGLPTRVQWTLPAGFVASEIHWPYPARFEAGPLVSYGYEGTLLLPVDIQVPTSIATGEVRIGARVSWLECQEACLPGKAELSLTLPVRSAVAPGPEAAAFAETRRRLPVSEPGWRVSASLRPDAVLLEIVPGGHVALDEPYFFAATPRVVDYAKPQDIERRRTGYRLRLARDPNGAATERLAGALVFAAAGRKRAVEIDAKMESSSTQAR